MQSRNGALTLAFAIAALGVVCLSLAAYFAGLAIVELDPDHRGNYGDSALANDPVARADVQEDRAEAATIAWALTTAAGVLLLGGMWLGWTAPPKEHRHVTTKQN